MLTDFWMLHGFRPLEEISEALAAEPELGRVMPGFDEKLRAARRGPAARSALLRELYARVMTMAQGEVDGILTPLVARLEAAEREGTLQQGQPRVLGAAGRAHVSAARRPRRQGHHLDVPAEPAGS